MRSFKDSGSTFWQKVLTVLACCLFVQGAYAATCSSENNGNWTSTNVWSCGHSPVAGDSVVITEDTVTLNANTALLTNLTIEDEAVLRGGTTGTGYTISLTGIFTNSGTFTPRTGTVYFAGANQTISGNATTFYNLNLGATALTLATNVNVTNTLSGTVNLVSTCPTNYTLTVQSTGQVYNSCANCNPLGTGLYGSYFNNAGAGAAPTFPTGMPALIRVDSQVNFNWGTGSPGAGVNADDFAVRWVGELHATTAGTYRFQTQSDDGVRLWVNGTQVINRWVDQSSTTTTSGNVSLSACQVVPIIMEFYENGTDAEARLRWSTPGTTTYVAIPQVQLYPSAPMVTSAQAGDCDYKTITVRFSRAMLSTSGTYGILNTANYVVSNGSSTIAVTGASASSDGMTVQLTLATALDRTKNATVTINNVRDASGLPMTAPSTYSVDLNPGGFLAKYYNWTGSTPSTDNPTGTPALTRVDSTINFDWSNTSSPGAGIGTDQFQGRWSGTVTIPTTGYYTFYATSDDGQRLWANGTLLIDNWVLQEATERTSTAQYYTQGQKVKIEYAMYENGGYAVAKLYWQAGTASGGSDILAKQPVSSALACPLPVTVPANFNAFDTSTAANSPNGVIKTKIAGASFSVDVVALTDAPSVKTDFVGDVLVELVDGSGTTACASRSAIGASGAQTLPFLAANAGRKSITFTEANAWPNVRVRMTYTPTIGNQIVACSSDAFAIRPNVLAVSVTDSNWETAGETRSLNNTSISGGNVHKAGRPFTIKATAYNAAATPAITGNYEGTPVAEITAYVLPTDCTVCALSEGAYTGGGGTVVTSTASYNEVGAFKMKLQDTQFAVVDAGDGSTLAERTIASSEINVGRFVPDHFTLKTGSAVTAACGGVAGFTYMDQPGLVVKYEIEARSYGVSNSKTANYSTTATNNLAGGTVNVVAENDDTGTNLAARMALPTKTWSSGAYGVNATDVTFRRRTLALDGTVNPDGPYDSLQLGVKVVDPDGVTLEGLDMSASTKAACGTACDSKAIGSPTKIRFGRLRLMNAHGSERLSLPIPMLAQYYNENGIFVTNALDNCTAIARENVVLQNHQGLSLSNMRNNSAADTNVIIGGDFEAGVGRLRLSAPMAAGSVDVCVDLGGDTPLSPARCSGTAAEDTWLKGRWLNASYIDDPKARATFGIHKKANEFIYIREMY